MRALSLLAVLQSEPGPHGEKEKQAATPAGLMVLHQTGTAVEHAVEVKVWRPVSRRVVRVGESYDRFSGRP